MSDSAGAALDAGEIREGQGFDEARLADWMTKNVQGYRGPLRILQFKGGQSNPTYKLVTPNTAYVLRRKPPGRILKGAHAVEREARVLKALRAVDFPVAQVYGECADEGIIGTAFYVMEMVEGRVFWDATFPQVAREERPRYFDAMNATLARLHSVDYVGIGLSDYGRPGRYCERQVERWSQQYLQDTDAGRDSNMDRLIDWLPANIPRGESVTSLVHGDFRCDNLIFHPTEPKVLAVLDWELSTLGDPLSDFAYHTMMYRMPPYIVAGLLGADINALNIPSESHYVATYCRSTGRETIPDFPFYMAFNFFRIAAIFHGIKGRVIRGTASSAEAMERVKVFPELARLAWSQVERR
jgi:aminoglycoside phosphotransferase (APT) family kinase protein